MEKQYLVVKIAKNVESALSVTPQAGALSWPVAMKFLERLRREDPESVYTLQEIGAA